MSYFQFDVELIIKESTKLSLDYLKLVLDLMCSEVATTTVSTIFFPLKEI